MRRKKRMMMSYCDVFHSPFFLIDVKVQIHDRTFYSLFSALVAADSSSYPFLTRFSSCEMKKCPRHDDNECFTSYDVTSWPRRQFTRQYLLSFAIIFQRLPLHFLRQKYFLTFFFFVILRCVDSYNNLLLWILPSVITTNQKNVTSAKEV